MFSFKKLRVHCALLSLSIHEHNACIQLLLLSCAVYAHRITRCVPIDVVLVRACAPKPIVVHLSSCRAAHVLFAVAGNVIVCVCSSQQRLCPGLSSTQGVQRVNSCDRVCFGADRSAIAARSRRFSRDRETKSLLECHARRVVTAMIQCDAHMIEHVARREEIP